MIPFAAHLGNSAILPIVPEQLIIRSLGLTANAFSDSNLL